MASRASVLRGPITVSNPSEDQNCAPAGALNNRVGLLRAWRRISALRRATVGAHLNLDHGAQKCRGLLHLRHGDATVKLLAFPPRSEERRVGKEGRSRWSPDH